VLAAARAGTRLTVREYASVARGGRFVVGFLGVGVILWAVGLAARIAAIAPADMIGTLLMAAYVITIQAIVDAVVYVVVTLAATRVRQPSPRRIAIIDVVAGAIACLMGWTGATLLLMSSMNVVTGWLAGRGFVILLPGLVTGVLAVVAGRVWATR
jgi:hypothetical protein